MRRAPWSPRVRAPGSPSVLTDVTLGDRAWQTLHCPQVALSSGLLADPRMQAVWPSDSHLESALKA